MNLADLQEGERVFIDANIFIYHFGGLSKECKICLERIARFELEGFTSTPVLAEVTHRLLVNEAIGLNRISPKNAIKKLANKPELVKQFNIYHDSVNQIQDMNIKILDLTFEVIKKSALIRNNTGLLTNDSFILVHMNEQGIANLATANGDFDRIDTIQVFKSQDID